VNTLTVTLDTLILTKVYSISEKSMKVILNEWMGSNEVSEYDVMRLLQVGISNKHFIHELHSRGHRAAFIADLLDLKEVTVYYHLRQKPKTKYFNYYIMGMAKGEFLDKFYEEYENRHKRDTPIDETSKLFPFKTDYRMLD
jgi:hypothetical protein